MKDPKNSIMELADLGLLRIEGPDAKKFLQGQLTCNMENISADQAQLGAQCNPQGRIIHFFRLFYDNDHFYLQMQADMVPIALNALKKYAIFYKVTLSNASDSLKVIGYVGDQLQNYLTKIPEKINEIAKSDKLLILKLSDRYQIMGEPAVVISLWDKLIAENPSVSSDIWKQFDFEENIPAIYPETSEKFLPHDLQLQHLNAISFNKGCYTGQEIIARMQYRGKIKNHLWQVSVKTELNPKRGADIYDSTNTAGMLVDYYKTGYNTYVLQIMAAKADGLFLDPDKHYPLTR